MPRLVRGFIVAGSAAGLTIHEAVGTDADIHEGLAEAAILFAFAAALGLFALRAKILGVTGCGAHGANVARGGGSLK